MYERLLAEDFEGDFETVCDTVSERDRPEAVRSHTEFGFERCTPGPCRECCCTEYREDLTAIHT